MIIATGGLLYLAYMRRLSAPAILLIMLLIIYINASWFNPTFSSSAGYRALVEWIPFMAIPLAFVIENIQKREGWKWALYGVLLLFVIYNLLFSYKYENNLWWNTEWQWSNFLRLVKF
jgi:drug/metabolite transporter (DMT)-like permease